jgi:hypothetical protein
MRGDGAPEYQPEAWARNKGAEKESLLPVLADPYRAAGFAVEEESCLVVVMGQAGFKAGSLAYVNFQYVHIGTGGFGYTANGQAFTFLVADIEPKRVTVRGRNLLRIYHQIVRRRIPWIRQADRDFRQGDGAPDDEPIILSIEVEDWKRPKRAQPDAAGDAEAEDE